MTEFLMKNYLEERLNALWTYLMKLRERGDVQYGNGVVERISELKLMATTMNLIVEFDSEKEKVFKVTIANEFEGDAIEIEEI